MRILKTTQTYFPYLHKGGPPTKVKGIASALARRGHEVTVLTADLGEANGAADLGDWKRKESPWGFESQHNGVAVIYLSTLLNYRATTVNRRVTRFCLRRLQDFDVVHIYGLYDLLGPTVAWFCRRRGIPYLVEPIGMFQPKVRSLQKKRLYRRLFGRTLLNGAAVIIATSETEHAELIAAGISAGKITLRRNGLDLSEFASLPPRGAFRAKLGIGERERLVLFVGRLSFIKGLDLLVQAFSGIDALQALPHGRATAPVAARLVIAGPDDRDGCVETLQSLIQQRGLGGQVSLHEPVYGVEKLQALVDADLLVLPSRYESFGNVAGEAVACGTPVLLTDRCGIAPLLNERAGRVVECTAEGLRAGLNRLLSDENLLTRLRSGCAGVAQELSWDEPIEQTEHIYSSLIATKDHPRPATVAQNLECGGNDAALDA